MTDLARYERALGPLEVGLRKDIHVSRQGTRGGPRYVLHDPVAFQNHAFSAEDYQILVSIVPWRNLEQVFAQLVRHVDELNAQHRLVPEEAAESQRHAVAVVSRAAPREAAVVVVLVAAEQALNPRRDEQAVVSVEEHRESGSLTQLDVE